MAEQEGFFDEKILEYRRRARNEKYSTLETGMYIKDEFVRFERVELFQGRLSIIIPTSFVNLPPNLTKIKYSSEQRPQVIKTSLDTTVNIGLSILDADILPEQVGMLCDQAKAALKRINPAYVFYENGVELENIPLGWFEFKSFGLDDNIFNLMFVTIAGGKMVHGIFNCNYDDAIEWREAARQMIHSIREGDIKEI